MNKQNSFHSRPWANGKQWFSDTWQPTKKNYGLLLGSILLGMGVSTVAQAVPVIGFLISIALSGAMYVGIFYIAHRSILSQKTHVQDVFICLQYRKEAWIQTAVFGLFTILFLILLLVAMGIAGFIVIGGVQIQQLLNDANQTGQLLINWPLFAFVECLIVLTFLTFIIPMYYFVYPLIFFKRMSAWDSMILSSKAVWGNIWSITNFGLIAGLIMFAGLLCLIVGVFFTLPWLYMGYIKSYHDIFGVPEADQTGLNPPAWDTSTQTDSPNLDI